MHEILNPSDATNHGFFRAALAAANARIDVLHNTARGYK
jgi:hypothetical protein